MSHTNSVDIAISAAVTLDYSDAFRLAIADAERDSDSEPGPDAYVAVFSEPDCCPVIHADAIARGYAIAEFFGCTTSRPNSDFYRKCFADGYAFSILNAHRAAVHRV